MSFLPWWDTFTPGQTLLAELDSLRNRAQGALLVVTPETRASIRGKDTEIPNLNVLFEFGFFYGAFGKDRVAIVKYGDVHLPNDLGGYIHISGKTSFSRGKSTKPSQRTCTEFRRWVESPSFIAASSGSSGTVSMATTRTRDELLDPGRRVISRGISRIF